MSMVFFPAVFQDERPVVVGEAGTSEVAEADGEEEHGAGRPEGPEGESAGGEDGRGEDHRRAQRTGRRFYICRTPESASVLTVTLTIRQK